MKKNNTDYTSNINWQALQAGLSVDSLIRDTAQMASYCFDAAHKQQREALAVVLPQSTLQIQHIVQWARQNCIALVPQGGHTNRVTGAIPEIDRPSLIVNFKRHNRIDPILASADSLTLDAGVKLSVAQAVAAQHDRVIGVDIGSRDNAQIGGMLATNAGGMQVARYGNMRAQLLGLEVITGQGKIMRHMQGLYKNNSGYEWMQLFVGAEGTLGLISRAILRLHPANHKRQTTLLCLKQVEDSIVVLRDAQQRFDCSLQRIELIPENVWIAMCTIKGVSPSLFSVTSPILLLLELVKVSQDELIDWIKQIKQKYVVNDVISTESINQQQLLWQIRECGSDISTIVGPMAKNDIALCPEKIPKFLNDCAKILQQYLPGVQPMPFGHLGDGNLHYNVAFPECGDGIDLDYHRSKIQNIVEDLVVKMGGTFSAEHGIGTTKLLAMSRHKESHILDLMYRIKKLFDPDNVCNPGKLLPLI